MRTKILMPLIMLLILVSASLAEVYQYEADKQETTDFLASLFSLFSAEPFQQGKITGTCPNCKATCAGITKDVSTYGWGSYGNCQGFMTAKGCSTTICQGVSDGGTQPDTPPICVPSCAGKCGITSNGCGGKCAYLECGAGSKCVDNKCVNDNADLTCTSQALRCSQDKTKKEFCDPKKGWIGIGNCPSDRECVEYSSTSLACELKTNLGGSCDAQALYSQKCFGSSIYACLNTQTGKAWQKLIDCPTSLPDCINPPSDKVAATCTKKTLCEEDTRKCYPTGAIWGCKAGEEIHVLEDCQYGCDTATNTCKAVKPSECQAISSCSNYNNRDSCVANSCAVGECVWTVENNVCKDKQEVLPEELTTGNILSKPVSTAECSMITKCEDYDNAPDCFDSPCGIQDCLVESDGLGNFKRCRTVTEEEKAEDIAQKKAGIIISGGEACEEPIGSNNHCGVSRTKEEFEDVTDEELADSYCEKDSNCIVRPGEGDTEFTKPDCVNRNTAGIEKDRIKPSTITSIFLNFLMLEPREYNACLVKVKGTFDFGFFTQEAFFGIPWWGVIAGIILVIVLLYSLGSKGGQR